MSHTSDTPPLSAHIGTKKHNFRVTWPENDDKWPQSYDKWPEMMTRDPEYYDKWSENYKTDF